MPALAPLPPHLTGAHFLIHDAAPSDVFTPEDLSAEDRQMAETAAKFMDKEVFPRLDALEHQEAGLARRLFGHAGELGLLCIEMPEDLGGLGLGKTSAIGVNEQLSRLAGFGITCAVHSGIGSQPLVHFGTEAQKRRYLPLLATGEWMAAYCLSEAGSGSDALGMKTKAVLSADSRHYVLNGVKMWITNGAWADLLTVFAKVDGEHVTAFLVERGYPGVSVGREEHKMGIKSSSTCRVILEDVKVPVKNVIGEVGKGSYIAFNTLNFGRYSLGAGLMGAARDQIRVAARYAQERQQFGRPLASFGLIQQKLAGMAAKVFAGESATHRIAGMIDSVAATGERLDAVAPSFPRSMDEFAMECSIAKVRCSEMNFEVADESIQIHGGYGFSEEFTPARALRDSRISRIFEGTNEINRLFIGGLLSRREQRGRFPLADAVARASSGLDALQPAPDTGDDLRNAQALLRGAKRLVFFLVGQAQARFGEKLGDEQEIQAALADVIAEVFLAESAVLRALKTRGRAPQNTVQPALAALFLAAAVPRLESAARSVLGALGRKDFAARLEAVRRLLSWTPPDAVALGREISRIVVHRGGYAV